MLDAYLLSTHFCGSSKKVVPQGDAKLPLFWEPTFTSLRIATCHMDKWCHSNNKTLGILFLKTMDFGTF